jgi:hypothetical protein
MAAALACGLPLCRPRRPHAGQQQREGEVGERVEEQQVRRADAGDQRAGEQRAGHAAEREAEHLQGVGGRELLGPHQARHEGRAAREGDHHQEAVDGGDGVEVPELQPAEGGEQRDERHRRAADQAVADQHQPPVEAVQQPARQQAAHDDRPGVADHQPPQGRRRAGEVVDEPCERHPAEGVAGHREAEADPEAAKRGHAEDLRVGAGCHRFTPWRAVAEGDGASILSDVPGALSYFLYRA